MHGDHNMPFGKHRGKPLAEIPGDYLRWLTGHVDLREPLRSRVLDELEGRETSSARPRLLRACPAPDVARELVRHGMRALAQRHHPDVGGSHAEMLNVTAAAEWLRGRIDAAA
jgi:hypothetical protein